MKGLGFLIAIAVIYILLLFLVQDILADQKNVTAQDSNEINSPNPLLQMFPSVDHSTAVVLDTLYGSYNGDEQCTRKAFCTMGNNVRNLPGRDLLFLFMGGYVPSEYSLYYDIFRNAAMYGQNCEVYVCKITDASTKVPPPGPAPGQPVKQQPRVAH